MAGRAPLDGDTLVATNLRARRTALGLSQAGLAAALDLTYQQIQKYEAGRNRITVGLLMEMARVLDTTPAALMTPPAPAPRTRRRAA